VFVFEGQGVGRDAYEFESHLVFNDVTEAVNAVVHEDLAVSGGGADAGHADGLDIIDGFWLKFGRRQVRLGRDGRRRGLD